MDPIKNPFAPGAGTPPPEMAGRESILTDAGVTLGRIGLGRPSRSQILLGLRGVGKTVLLNRIEDMARNQGYEAIAIEAPEDRRLAQMLVPPLRALLLRLNSVDGAKELVKRALGGLRSFAGVFKVEVGEIGFGIQSEKGMADTGDLEFDLPELLVSVASAAKEAKRPIALLIDEMQYLSQKDLSALIISIHKMGQRGLPFLLFGAGLPQLAGLAGEAKSYAERLFLYPGVGKLTDEAARDAIRAPIEREGAKIRDDAIEFIRKQTQGYPYFLQEWGFHAWDVSERSPISLADAKRATTRALRQLDQGFFRVRFDQLTPREKDYMRAMAALGPGPHRSGAIALEMAIDVKSAGPLRGGLIKKGMIYSPAFAETAFTVPMFDEFMKRSVPDWQAGSIDPAEPSRRRKRPKH